MVSTILVSPKAILQSAIIVLSKVPKILATVLNNAKSRDFLSDELIGHAFRP